MSRAKLCRWTAIMCVIAAATLAGKSLHIHAKAALAQYLIRDAWSQSLHDGVPVKPWRWADTWPVAKLDFSSVDKKLWVLRGSQGATLAFGPGVMEGAGQPGSGSTAIIGGHRDTHFHFLKNLKNGDSFRLQTVDGKWHKYQLYTTEVVDIREGNFFFSDEANEIHLVTCFPFDAAQPGGPLRFVASARLLSF